MTNTSDRFILNCTIHKRMNLSERSMVLSRNTPLICQTLVLNYVRIHPCIRELQSGHEIMHINIESALWDTRVPSCDKLSLWKIILKYIRKLQPRHKRLHINIHAASVILTFEIGMWSFRATHVLIYQTILSSCMEIYWCSTKYGPDKNCCIITFKLQCNLNLLNRGMVHLCYTLSWYAKHLCIIISKSFYA